MNNVQHIINMIVSAFSTSFKNNHMNGLNLDSRFKPMEEVCAFFDGDKVHAYGCFRFDLDEHVVFVYDTYGDEDDEVHEDIETAECISMGFCFFIDTFFYCFDMNEKGDVINFSKTMTPCSVSPEFFCGKRAFYHYRDKNLLSMKNFDSGFQLDEHCEARKWTSGPRTLFKLAQFSIS